MHCPDLGPWSMAALIYDLCYMLGWLDAFYNAAIVFQQSYLLIVYSDNSVKSLIIIYCYCLIVLLLGWSNYVI